MQVFDGHPFLSTKLFRVFNASAVLRSDFRCLSGTFFSLGKTIALDVVQSTKTTVNTDLNNILTISDENATKDGSLSKLDGDPPPFDHL